MTEFMGFCKISYPGINITHPFCYLRGNVHFDWFDQYLCTGEHLQSDLDLFQFDFMFVKPHEVPPLLYANMQTEMRFGVEQLLFQSGRSPKVVALFLLLTLVAI